MSPHYDRCHAPRANAFGDAPRLSATWRLAVNGGSNRGGTPQAQGIMTGIPTRSVRNDHSAR
jgi:hypothetical protein